MFLDCRKKPEYTGTLSLPPHSTKHWTPMCQTSPTPPPPLREIIPVIQNTYKTMFLLKRPREAYETRGVLITQKDMTLTILCCTNKKKMTLFMVLPKYTTFICRLQNVSNVCSNMQKKIDALQCASIATLFSKNIIQVLF